MWLLAGAAFLACKITAWQLRPPTALHGRLAWFFLWPGMEAAPFLQPRQTLPPAPAHRWAGAGGKLVAGVLLLWVVTRRLPPPAAGWCAMLGLVLLLHFGSFELLALAYRAAGFPVRPIMCHPLASRSVAEFWGVRWNRAFRDWAHPAVFRPLERHLGPDFAAVGVYLVSGLLHELVITIPAGGGYGLPSAYFLLQAVGSKVERTPFGRRWLRGRGFTFLLTAGPAYWLFPPPFVQRVILPFLEALHAR